MVVTVWARPAEEEASIVSIWTLVRFVHVLSAMAWVGGQLLLSLLVLPVLRSLSWSSPEPCPSLPPSPSVSCGCSTSTRSST
jgi:hypothetical protein